MNRMFTRNLRVCQNETERLFSPMRITYICSCSKSLLILYEDKIEMIVVYFVNFSTPSSPLLSCPKIKQRRISAPFFPPQPSFFPSKPLKAIFSNTNQSEKGEVFKSSQLSTFSETEFKVTKVLVLQQ